MSVDGVLIITLHLAGLLVDCIGLLFFLRYELLRHNSSRDIWKNKFVKCTFLLGLSLGVREVLVIPRKFHLFYGALDDRRDMILLLVSAWPTVLSLAMHVMNVYMRSSAVIRSSSKVATVVRVLAGLFWFFGILTVLSSIVLIGATNSLIAEIVFGLSGIAYGVVLGVLDAVCTYSFVRYVYTSGKVLGIQHHVVMAEASGVIALFGAIISSLSLTAVFLYAYAQTIPQDQVTKQEWVFTFSFSIVHGVGMFWIVMKIKLDHLMDSRGSGKTHAKQTSSDGANGNTSGHTHLQANQADGV
eukprot:TRINITY_DN9507_c0_g1_i1.p1 TRINITY_DN9507_c0_g1~~TRINITY_DN9507_c0_g1_i1.p1  ORF type:complete len:300 (-),score=62.47 TRINITY_DN9507_c0_g1_i1:120-1019(-)